MSESAQSPRTVSVTAEGPNMVTSEREHRGREKHARINAVLRCSYTLPQSDTQPSRLSNVSLLWKWRGWRLCRYWTGRTGFTILRQKYVPSLHGAASDADLACISMHLAPPHATVAVRVVGRLANSVCWLVSRSGVW